MNFNTLQESNIKIAMYNFQANGKERKKKDSMMAEKKF